MPDPKAFVLVGTHAQHSDQQFDQLASRWITKESIEHTTEWDYNGHGYHTVTQFGRSVRQSEIILPPKSAHP